MTFVRLSQFVEVSEIPERAIFDLILSNQLPMQIDSEGYLSIDIDASSVKPLLAKAIEVTTSQMSEEQKLIEAHFEKIIGDEIASIVKDALERLNTQ